MNRHLPLLDLMKGIAIFLVVAGHVLTMCIRDIDRAPLFKFIGEVHMPLFFFVSGFLSMRRNDNGDIVRPKLWSRVVRLLVPMVAVSTLWIYWFPASGLQSPLEPGWSGLWGSMWKNGYWFTLVLFEITLLYIPITLIFNRMRKLWAQIATTLAYCGLVGVAFSFLPAHIASISSLPLAAMFLPPFLAGAIAADRREAFLAWSRRSTVQTVAILSTAVLMAYVGWYWRYPFIPSWALGVARSCLHIAIAIMAVGILGQWSTCRSRAVDLWCLLGRKSLAIYLLHYFFLFPMGGLRPWLEACDLAIIPLGAVCILTSAAIIAAVLAVDYALCFSKPLSMLLTGSKPHKMPSPCRS